MAIFGVKGHPRINVDDNGQIEKMQELPDHLQMPFGFHNE
jgi:hypothetical protein